MSSSNINNPSDTSYPDAVSSNPTSEPKPSTRQDLPPKQNDVNISQADQPDQTSNPVKKGAGGVEQGTKSIGKEGTEGTDGELGRKTTSRQIRGDDDHSAQTTSPRASLPSATTPQGSSTGGHSSVKSFLKTAKTELRNAIKQHERVTLVMGNEAADLDSIASAIVFSYLRSASPPKSAFTPLYIPLLNIGRSEITDRPQLRTLFPKVGIDFEDLVTLDDLLKEGTTQSGLTTAQTRMFLVNQNMLLGRQGQDFSQNIAGCIDIHKDEGYVPKDTGAEPRIIKKAASCTSLVVNYFADKWGSLGSGSAASGQSGSGVRGGATGGGISSGIKVAEQEVTHEDRTGTTGASATFHDSTTGVSGMESEGHDSRTDAQLAKLALASILILTLNMQDQNITTSEDRMAVDLLLAKIKQDGEPFNPHAFYQELIGMNTNETAGSMNTAAASLSTGASSRDTSAMHASRGAGSATPQPSMGGTNMSTSRTAAQGPDLSTLLAQDYQQFGGSGGGKSTSGSRMQSGTGMTSIDDPSMTSTSGSGMGGQSMNTGMAEPISTGAAGSSSQIAGSGEGGGTGIGVSEATSTAGGISIVNQSLPALTELAEYDLAHSAMQSLSISSGPAPRPGHVEAGSPFTAAVRRFALSHNLGVYAVLTSQSELFLWVLNPALEHVMTSFVSFFHRDGRIAGLEHWQGGESAIVKEMGMHDGLMRVFTLTGGHGKGEVVGMFERAVGGGVAS